ncbi:MAG: hypothetical protein H6Q49_106 [Deltaproteobacteria bacterium]|nr:hypothetical protein [Deltaproteobacteria bacterium]
MKTKFKGHRNGEIFFIACIMLMTGVTQGIAQDAQIQSGRYIREGGSGSLIIKQGKTGALSFVIETVGANGHTCGLEGNILNGKATLESFDAGKPCIVNFLPKDSGVNVTVNDSECQYYCGVRATFAGLYLIPIRGCDPLEIRKARNEFKRLYDKKVYDQAGAKLEKILRDCVNTLDWLETGWIRNDLAITQYKLNDLQGCWQTLQPLATDAARTDEDVRNDYPPSDADMYLPIVRAARTNLKLCTSGKK